MKTTSRLTFRGRTSGTGPMPPSETWGVGGSSPVAGSGPAFRCAQPCRLVRRPVPRVTQGRVVPTSSQTTDPRSRIVGIPSLCRRGDWVRAPTQSAPAALSNGVRKSRSSGSWRLPDQPAAQRSRTPRREADRVRSAGASSALDDPSTPGSGREARGWLAYGIRGHAVDPKGRRPPRDALPWDWSDGALQPRGKRADDLGSRRTPIGQRPWGFNSVSGSTWTLQVGALHRLSPQRGSGPAGR
jgi:hypothetical protein